MRRPWQGCPFQSCVIVLYSATMADEITVPSGAGRDIGVDPAGMMKSRHQASMKWVRELVNFPASKIQKGACKNGTPAKGDVCSGPEGVKGGQSLAREGQVINEHNARAPSPGLLFPLQMVQQLNSYEECLHVPLGSAAFAGYYYNRCFGSVIRHSCWGPTDQTVTTKWLI